jgi:hypothetical protein
MQSRLRVGPNGGSYRAQTVEDFGLWNPRDQTRSSATVSELATNSAALLAITQYASFSQAPKSKRAGVQPVAALSAESARHICQQGVGRELQEIPPFCAGILGRPIQGFLKPNGLKVGLGEPSRHPDLPQIKLVPRQSCAV